MITFDYEGMGVLLVMSNYVIQNIRIFYEISLL